MPDPVAPVLLALVVILAGAKLGGDLAERIGQPAWPPSRASKHAHWAAGARRSIG